MHKKIFITREILPDGLDLLKSHDYDVHINPFKRSLHYEELLELSGKYDGFITMLSDRLDSTFFEKNPQLKIVANYAVGFNNIDLNAAQKNKCAITNTPDVLTEATAEVALGLMINSARHFKKSSQEAKLGQWKDWNPTAHLGLALNGKTLGIVGMGRIGYRLAEMASAAFKMTILYTSSSSPKKNGLNAKHTSLGELISQSDFISLHVPLNKQTQKLIGKKEFSMMKKDAILINTARGEIIDQEALVWALEEKRLFAVGLDVCDPEPLPTTHPLFQFDNVTLLPHIGSATYEARKEMSLLCARNIMAALEGRQLLTPVSPMTY